MSDPGILRDEIAAELARLVALEARLIRIRPRLEGVAGAAALDYAIDHFRPAREALAQVEEELDVESGVYLATSHPER